VRELPELFDNRVKARSLAYLFLAGAALGALTVLLPHADEVMERELLLLAAVAAVMAVGIYLVAGSARTWQLHVAVALGTVMLSLANYYVEATVTYPLLYTWTALFAFYFFRVVAALWHVAFIGVCYAIVLIAVEPGSPIVRWLLAVGTPLVVGLLLTRVLGRTRVEAFDADRRADALQQSEARTRLLLDSAPDAFLTLDRDGVITSWNSAAERLFGWTSAEAIGAPMRVLIIPSEFRDRHDDRRNALLATPSAVATQRFDVEFLRRDGTRFPGEATVSKIEVKGEPFVSGFIRDVSERVRREAEREALMREQAARAEAERVTDLVSRVTLLVDAALASGTLDEILSSLVGEVREVLEAGAATIMLTEEDERLSVRASAGPPQAAAGTGDQPPETIAFGEGFAGRVAQTREAMLAHGPSSGDLPDQVLSGVDVDSLIGVPLLADNTVTGVLLAGAAAPRRFSPDDLTLLRLAADRVALAILHARLYDREHRIAETLQRSLLPDRLPQPPGLEVAARYEPAAAEAEVGGDWYDVIPMPGGSVGLVMSDVAGKGLGAASMVGRLRSALRAYALEGHDAARVVEQLNRLVWTDGGEGQMATLLYVVVDPSESEMRWVNAGHLAPLLVARNGQPRFLEGGGSVPLGVLAFPTYEQQRVGMEPGSTVVLYTDGLIERPGEHLDDGMEQLAARVREAADDPERLCQHLLRTLLPVSGATDDVAILALRNLPVSDRFTVSFASDPESLAPMRSMLRRWLGHANGGEDEVAEIVTACGEAATNAIEHAGGAGGRPFEVSGRLDGREVEICVRDWGSWRSPRPGDQGRGISLMGGLMGTVEVVPSEQGTTVRMTRRLLGDEGES
jgi:PAS domain S-box-containing protein